MKIYKSKISYGLLLFVFLILSLSFATGLIYGKSTNDILVSLGIFFLTFGFVLYLFFNTEYTIFDDFLKIKCGFIYNKKLRIFNIKSISKTNSLISSPAASFDRIELRYWQFGSVIISPKDKIGFAKELLRINPTIGINFKL